MKFLSKPVDALDVVSWTVFCNVCTLTTDRPINTAWDWGRGLGRHMASSFPVLVSSFKGYQEARGKDTHPGLFLICCGYEQRIHAAVGVRTAGNTKGIPLPVPQFRDS